MHESPALCIRMFRLCAHACLWQAVLFRYFYVLSAPFLLHVPHYALAGWSIFSLHHMYPLKLPQDDYFSLHLICASLSFCYFVHFACSVSLSRDIHHVMRRKRFRSRTFLPLKSHGRYLLCTSLVFDHPQRQVSVISFVYFGYSALFIPFCIVLFTLFRNIRLRQKFFVCVFPSCDLMLFSATCAFMLKFQLATTH